MSFGHQMDVFIETSKHQKSCRYPTGGEREGKKNKKKIEDGINYLCVMCVYHKSRRKINKKIDGE